MKKPAAGILETNNLATAIEAADQMIKSASINDISKFSSGSSIFTVIVRGDAPSVEAALSAGERSARNNGAFLNSFLITDLHNEVEKLLTQKEQLL